MTARVSLASIADTASFLVPVLGFADRAAADRYIEQATTDGAQVFASGEGFEPLHLPSRSYVSPVDIRHDDWDTNRVFGSPMKDKPFWVKLRSKSAAKPVGSYNVVLMVEGVRSFYRHVEHKARVLPYMYRLLEGRRDCYAVWSGYDGRTLQPIRTTGNGNAGEAQPGQRIFATRSGRGVLYSRVANYNSKGEKSGYTLRIVRVEFTVLDRLGDRDDMLMVKVYKDLEHSYCADQIPAFHKDDRMDDAWAALVERAENGFNRWCREVPEEVETWRAMFVDQKAKADADRELNLSIRREDSFHHRVTGMDWQSALAEVQEPWQLQTVVLVHCNSQFDDSPHRWDSHGHRVGVMLSRVENAERRAVLSKMVSDFVAPCDKLWSYTGD